MTGKPALEFRGVSVVFSHRVGAEQKQVLALSSVSFDVTEGSFVAIVGPSGCGKSTLLRVCDGLIPPTQGEVLLYGEPVRGPGRERAMVFQQHNLFPWRTALGNVEFGLEMLGVPKQERRARAKHYLALVGLEAFADYYPHQLSGGMQQRVGLARALAVEPQVLLMDEPFGALDAQTRSLLQEELARIWSQNRKTVLFVTHDIEEALFLSDRVIVMSSRPGRVVRDITVPFGRPRSEEVRVQPDFAALKEDIWLTLKREQSELVGSRRP